MCVLPLFWCTCMAIRVVVSVQYHGGFLLILSFGPFATNIEESDQIHEES